MKALFIGGTGTISTAVVKRLFLMKKYREEGFPVTIVRPSHTYDERKIPLGVHGSTRRSRILSKKIPNEPCSDSMRIRVRSVR